MWKECRKMWTHPRVGFEALECPVAAIWLDPAASVASPLPPLAGSTFSLHFCLERSKKLKKINK